MVLVGVLTNHRPARLGGRDDHECPLRAGRSLDGSRRGRGLGSRPWGTLAPAGQRCPRSMRRISGRLRHHSIHRLSLPWAPTSRSYHALAPRSCAEWLSSREPSPRCGTRTFEAIGNAVRVGGGDERDDRGRGEEALSLRALRIGRFVLVPLGFLATSSAVSRRPSGFCTASGCVPGTTSHGFILESPAVAFRSEPPAVPCLRDQLLGKNIHKPDRQRWTTSVYGSQAGRSAITRSTSACPPRRNGPRSVLSQMRQRGRAGNGGEVEHVFS